MENNRRKFNTKNPKSVLATEIRNLNARKDNILKEIKGLEQEADKVREEIKNNEKEAFRSKNYADIEKQKLEDYKKQRENLEEDLFNLKHNKS